MVSGGPFPGIRRFFYAVLLLIPICAALLQTSAVPEPLAAASPSDVSTNMGWSEGQYLRMTSVWNAQERAAGSYSPGDWPQGSLATDRAFVFAAREVLRDEWNINDVIVSEHSGAGSVQIAEAETNYYRQHADYPAHFHLNFIWPNWSGLVNSHFYTTEDGKVKQPLVLWNGAEGCAAGDNHPAAGEWWPEYDQACKPVWYQSWTVDGAVELKLSETAPVYTVRARDISGDLSGADVYQGDQKLYAIDVVKYDPVGLRMVVEVADYRRGKLVTESFVGIPDPWDPLGARVVEDTPLADLLDVVGEAGLSPAAEDSGSDLGVAPSLAVPKENEVVCTRYVSTSGSDSNPGTIDEPWRSVAKAGASAQAGDTVCFRAGVWNERLEPSNSGTASAPIVFTAYPGEEHQAILDLGQKTGYKSYKGIVNLDGKSYITISKLRLTNGEHWGVASLRSSDILIEDNEIDYTWGSGIYISGSHNVVAEGNDLQRVTHMQGGSSPHESISILGGTDGFEIKNNRIHNPYRDPTTGEPLSKEGIDAKDSVANGKIYGNYVNVGHTIGIYVDGYATYARNIEISGNESTGNSYGVVITAEQRGTDDGIRVYNNIVHHNKLAGIRVIGWVSGGWTKNVEVVNNTLYGNGSLGIDVSNDELENVVVRNNISLGHTSKDISIGSAVPADQVTADHNLLSGDGGFVDAANGDYHLQAGSAAIDAGSELLAPSVDRDGVSRPVGSGFDLGAYEFESAQ